jgi:hypothetical protein
LEALELLGEAQFELLGQGKAALKNLRLCIRRDPEKVSGCDRVFLRIVAVIDAQQRVQNALAKEDWAAVIAANQEQLALDKTSPLAKAAEALLCTMYGARFPTESSTRGCHWIPRMFA